MIADDDPVVGIHRAGDFSDDVPDDAALIVLLGDEVCFNGALSVNRAPDLAQVIAEGQGALPA